MDPDRWRAVETLFHQALELEEPARSLFLEVQCEGDFDLRREVDEWLAILATFPELECRGIRDLLALVPGGDPAIVTI